MVSKVSQKLDASKKNLWEKKYFFEVLVLLFTFILYLNSIPNSYNLDDELVTINHRLTSKGISAIPEIFSSPYYQDASGYSYEYRPIVLASFAIEHHFFGDSPTVGHFFNIILYGIVCVVLYQLLLLLFKQYSSFIAIAVTLLFVSHPAHTEVVCSIKNRDEILSLLFGLLSFHAAYKFVFGKWKWNLFLVPFYFMLSLMSKNTMNVFIVVIPLSLILFTEAKLKELLILTILLLAPAFFLLSVGNIYSKLLFSFLAILLVAMFFVIMRFNKIKSWLLPVLSSAFSKKWNVQTKQTSFSSETISFKEILPTTNGKNAMLFFLCIAMTVLYVALIYSGHFVIACVVPLSFIAIVGWSGKRNGFWPLIALNTLIVYSTYIQNEGVMKQVMVDLAQLNIIYLIFFGNRVLKYFALFFLVLLFIMCSSFFDTITIMKYLFVFYVVRNRKYVIAFVLLQIAALIFEQIFFRAMPFTNMHWKEFIPTLLSLMALLILHTMKRKGKVAILIFSLLPLFVFHVHNFGNENLTSLSSKVISVSNMANQTNVNVISVNENRPINYVETCIIPNDSWAIKLGTSFEILFHYVYKVVLPYPMSFYYGYKFISPQKITDTLPFLSLCIYLFIVCAALYLLFKRIVAGLGLVIYLVSIATFSNLFIPVPGMLADRFLLLPSLGWLIFVVGILDAQTTVSANPIEYWINAKKRTKYLLSGLLLLYCGITFSRNRDWENHLVLYRKDIKYVENSAQAHNLLALQLMKDAYNLSDPHEQFQQRNEAIFHFKKAVELYPIFFNATYDLGRSYLSINAIDSAIVYFKNTAKLDTSFIDAYSISGQLLIQQNRLDEAKYFYEEIIRKRPQTYIGYEGLGQIYFIKKEYSAVQNVLKTAIANIPPTPNPYIMIGKTYYALNQRDSTRIWLNRAMEVSPGNTEIKQLLLSLDQK